jgi:hypothetical protein
MDNVEFIMNNEDNTKTLNTIFLNPKSYCLMPIA